MNCKDKSILKSLSMVQVCNQFIELFLLLNTLLAISVKDFIKGPNFN